MSPIEVLRAHFEGKTIKSCNGVASFEFANKKIKHLQFHPYERIVELTLEDSSGNWSSADILLDWKIELA